MTRGGGLGGTMAKRETLATFVTTRRCHCNDARGRRFFVTLKIYISDWAR
jgi:hypothetical protein